MTTKFDNLKSLLQFERVRGNYRVIMFLSLFFSMVECLEIRKKDQLFKIWYINYFSRQTKFWKNYCLSRINASSKKTLNIISKKFSLIKKFIIKKK